MNVLLFYLCGRSSGTSFHVRACADYHPRIAFVRVLELLQLLPHRGTLLYVSVFAAHKVLRRRRAHGFGETPPKLDVYLTYVSVRGFIYVLVFLVMCE